MKTSIRRSLASVLAATIALTGALTMGSVSTAQAATTFTDYGFETSAWGTYVSTGPVGLVSNRTAHSYIGCTRRAGIADDRSVAAAQTQGSPKVLDIGAVASMSRTYRRSNGQVGTLSQNNVASVTLGDPSGVNIQIKGLRTRTDAFATKAGKFGTKSSFSSVDIAAHTGVPAVDQVLGQAGAGISDLLELVAGAANDVLKIPGLGEISLGKTWNKKYYAYAEANAAALVVRLYGADGRFGGTGTGADITVHVGKARSRISRNVTSGVFRGFAQAAKVSLLDSLLGVGPLGEQRVNCQGTNGVVRRNAVAGLDVGNAGVVQIGALEGSGYAKQYDNGAARAWTMAKVAGIKLGNGDTSLEIRGIVGRANIAKYPSGAVHTSTVGSQVLSIIVNGQARPLPVPGRTIEIPGLARIQFMVVEKPSRRDIKVTAIRITLLDKTPGVSVINLGVAKMGIGDF